ncbi:hypothetical protein LINPERPRIM_LOCUS12373 [Linum perenne]
MALHCRDEFRVIRDPFGWWVPLLLNGFKVVCPLI